MVFGPTAGAALQLQPAVVEAAPATSAVNALLPARPADSARTDMRVVAYYHVGKTGGSSILHWFSRSLRARLFNYYHTQCFYAMPAHSDLFPQFASPNTTKHCARKGFDPLGVRNSSVVLVEYHAATQQEYWRLLRPGPLRDALSVRHRRFVTMVTVRDPVPHMLSYYTMWGHAATREQKRKGLLVAPLAEWLRAEAPGLQTFELLAGRLQPSRAPERGCNASVSALAVERLQSFDLSCNLRWIDACLRRLARALNVTALHDSIRDDLRVRPGQADSLRKGTEARLSAVNNATKHELAALDENISYGAVRRAAACDQRLLDAEAHWASFPSASASASERFEWGQPFSERLL